MKVTAKLVSKAVLLLVIVTSLIGCKGQSQNEQSSEADEPQEQSVSLTGAGATFPFPLYSKWMSEYNRANPNVKINYQSIGSGGGIRQIMAETVDFGATDAPMTEEEEKKAKRRLLHIPTTIGAVVVAYSVPGLGSKLRLTGPVLAGIFLGTIDNWNDPRITELNPDAKLPGQPIAVVHRSDGSGTTAVFTDYLAAVEPKWKEKVGVGKSVKWPTGLGAKGNEGVTGQIKTTPGAIGYLELAYAHQNKLDVALIKNKAGNFVAPKIEAITAAAKGVEMPESLHVSLTDAAGEDAYPISSYTYLLVYENMKDEQNAQALAEFLWWAVHDGQKYAKDLDYAPLPEPVVKQVESRLKQLRSGNEKLLDDGA